MALLDQCAPVFAAYEPRRLLDVATQRGIIATRSGDHDAALRAFRQVLAAIVPTDRARYADALQNVGAVLIELGELDDAGAAIKEADAIVRELGRTTEVMRCDYHRARIASARGLHDLAAEMFVDTSDRFAAAGDADTALRVGKDGAVALVRAGRVADARGVLNDLLAKSVLNTDRRRFTADALNFLRELAAHDALTADVADTVSAYVDRIHAQRATPFIPPFPRNRCNRVTL